MNYEESLMITVSTAHITKSDKDLLEADKQEAVFSDRYEYGFYICLSKDLPKEEIIQAGFSEQFARIYLDCVAEKANHLRLDCDGATYEEYEQYKW